MNPEVGHGGHFPKTGPERGTEDENRRIGDAVGPQRAARGIRRDPDPEGIRPIAMTLEESEVRRGTGAIHDPVVAIFTDDARTVRDAHEDPVSPLARAKNSPGHDPGFSAAAIKVPFAVNVRRDPVPMGFPVDARMPKKAATLPVRPRAPDPVNFAPEAVDDVRPPISHRPRRRPQRADDSANAFVGERSFERDVRRRARMGERCEASSRNEVDRRELAGPHARKDEIDRGESGSDDEDPLVLSDPVERTAPRIGVIAGARADRGEARWSSGRAMSGREDDPVREDRIAVRRPQLDFSGREARERKDLRVHREKRSRGHAPARFGEQRREIPGEMPARLKRGLHLSGISAGDPAREMVRIFGVSAHPVLTNVQKVKRSFGTVSDPATRGTGFLGEDDPDLSRLRGRRFEETNRGQNPGRATADDGDRRKGLRIPGFQFHILRMYQPDHFRTGDSALIRDLLRDYPFATLLTDEGREINSVPLLLREDLEGRMVLEGHVARGNPVAGAAERAEEVRALFQGPQAYISPLWYRSPGQVPTWNYAVVNVRGRFAPIDDAEETLAAMARLIRRFEGPDGWSMDGLPARARDGLFAAIRYFRIEVTEVEAKIKLSQNRAKIDQDAVLARLDASADPRHSEMATYFRRANHS